MKKQILQEVAFCDVCDQTGAYYPCSHCHKDFCHDCKEHNTVELPDQLYNLVAHKRYCHECFSLPEVKNSKLVKLLLQIKGLRHELEGFNKDFKERRDRLEDQIAKVLKG